MRETREAGDNLVGYTFGESFQVGARAGVFERQHSDPKTLGGAGLPGNGLRRGAGAGGELRSACGICCHRNRSDEPVSTLGNCLDVKGLLSCIAQRLAQFHHGRIQAMIEINESVRRPKDTAQILASNNLPRFLQKEYEDSIGLFPDLDGNPPRRSSSFCASTSNRPKRQQRAAFDGVATNRPPALHGGSLAR